MSNSNELSEPALGSEKESSIHQWLVQKVAELLKLDPSEIDPKKNLSEYGLDSMAAVILTGELEDFLKREVGPTLPYEYPTIDSLAKKLAHED